jgi:hypothetical protein
MRFKEDEKIMAPMEAIHIAARGKGWLCVEKPSGISVHNEPGKGKKVAALLNQDRLKQNQ